MGRAEGWPYEGPGSWGRPPPSLATANDLPPPRLSADADTGDLCPTSRAQNWQSQGRQGAAPLARSRALLPGQVRLDPQQ